MRYLNRTKTTVGILLVLLAALALAACSQAEPTATPAPTAIPTPEPTQGPLVVTRDASLPAPDPIQLAQVSDLLASISSNYRSVVTLDVQGLEESPVLRGLVDPDRLGIPGIIPLDASAILDAVAVAATDGGQVTVMQGNIDIASMLNLIGGFGIPIDIPDPENYQGHQVWDIDILGITLALGQADLSTAIFSSGSPTGRPAVAKVKESLDAFDGTVPGFLSRPNAQRLLERLPSGFAAALLAECAELGQIAAIIDIPGCAGEAISAEITGAGEVTFYGLAAFEDETQASAALEIALEKVQEEDSLPFDEVAVGQEEELIWTVVTVRSEKVAEALEAFELFNE